MYVYIMSEPNSLWTVGFYRPDGTFEPDNDYNDKEAAANRVAWLNGNTPLQGEVTIEESRGKKLA